MKDNSDTEQNSVKNRLLDFLKYKGISQSKFEQQCGISNGYVNNIRKGIKSEMFDKKIAPIFPELSKTWLLLGEGSMLVPQIEEVVPEEEEDDLVLFLRDERKGYDITLTDIYEKTRIPVKTLKEVQQGVTELSTKQKNVLSKYIEEAREYFQEEAIGNPIGKPTGYYYPEVYAKAGFDIANFNDEMQRIPVYIPNFGDDVTFINVYGDSMYPKYKAGDVIGIKPVDFVYLVCSQRFR